MRISQKMVAIPFDPANTELYSGYPVQIHLKGELEGIYVPSQKLEEDFYVPCIDFLLDTLFDSHGISRQSVAEILGMDLVEFEELVFERERINLFILLNLSHMFNQPISTFLIDK